MYIHRTRGNLMEVNKMHDAENKRFLDVKDIVEYMGVSTSMAYRIIHQLNDELKEQGYLTVSGKVSRIYFEEKTYMGRRA